MTELHLHIVIVTCFVVLAGLLLHQGVNAPPSRRQRFALIGGVIVTLGAVTLAVLSGLSVRG